MLNLIGKGELTVRIYVKVAHGHVNRVVPWKRCVAGSKTSKGNIMSVVIVKGILSSGGAGYPGAWD